jgi:lysophospholipase L1-like esterase
MKDGFAKLMLVLVSSLAVVVLAELALKMFPDEQESTEQKFWTYDPELGWFHVKGTSGTFDSQKHNFHGVVNFDDLGLRKNGAPPLDHPATRILLLGDSTTAGLEVNDGETFASLLEGRLRQAGKSVRVYNAGVRGYGTDQELLLLRRLKPLLKPDIVIYTFCENDLRDNMTIKNRYRVFSKPAFVIDGPKLTLLNSPPAKMYLEEYSYINYRDGRYEVQAGAERSTGIWSWLRAHSYFYSFLDDLYYYKVRNSAVLNPDFDQGMQTELLVRLVGAMQAESPRFFMAAFTQSDDPSLDKYGFVRDLAAQHQIPFIDAIQSFKAGESYFYPRDGHWNQAGHQAFAAGLFERLKNAI